MSNDFVAVDLVGDVHGCCEALERLLRKLGYRQQRGVYTHPEARQVIFVGDLLDRGPKIRETVALVKRMCEVGSARMILGNHEYNALRYAQGCREFIKHGESLDIPDRVKQLMSETLNQFTGHLSEWDDMMHWLSSLPLFIEHAHFRVVHACWDQSFIDAYRHVYASTALTPEFLAAAKQSGSFEARMVDRLTRGTNIPLPEGMAMEGKDGFVRRFFRTKFWALSPKTYGDVVFQPDPLPYDLHEQPIHDDHHSDLIFYDSHEVPVFFGHYWLSGRPEPLRKNIACLDYSAVNDGRMTAYRFNGETALNKDHFVWVYQNPHFVTEHDDVEPLTPSNKGQS